MFWKKKPARELSLGRDPYATPYNWTTLSREPDGLGVFDVEKEGLYEPPVGFDRVYAITVTDGSGSQIVYTDDNPIIHVREL